MARHLLDRIAEPNINGLSYHPIAHPAILERNGQRSLLHLRHDGAGQEHGTSRRHRRIRADKSHIRPDETSRLRRGGGSMADITKLTIFVTDIANQEKVWKARAKFFEGDFPACSLVEVSALADLRILVEIEGVAHLGQSA